jgi:tetratricopeptide (TPR) repeat protein
VIAPLVMAGAALQLPLPPCTDPLKLIVPSAWYLSLIDRYRGGGRETVVAEFIPSERFQAEIWALGELLRYERLHRGCPIPSYLVPLTGEMAVTLKAAALLHTDRALRLFDLEDGGAPGELKAVVWLLALMDKPARRDFEARWARAAALELGRHGKWESALTVLDPAVKDYPDDPLLQLARGAVFEALCRLEHAIHVRQRLGGWVRTRALKPAAPREGRLRLEQAESHYRRALALRPDLLHARVRLGRVLQLMDRTEDSVRELQAVVASAPARLDARDAYLARLFLGFAQEHAGALDGAITEYERALGVVPDGQAAAVALSHALHRAGRWPASLEALQSGVVYSGRRPKLDPWWRYEAAQTEESDGLEELRAEVSR